MRGRMGHPGRPEGYWTFLRGNSDYRYLWIGATFSLLADQINQVASVLLALSISDGSRLSAGLILGLKSVLYGLLLDHLDVTWVGLLSGGIMTASGIVWLIVMGREEPVQHSGGS
jgi:hypothetical protein